MDAFQQILIEWKKLSLDDVYHHMEDCDAGDHVEDEYFEMNPIRRNRKTICKMCVQLYSDYIPPSLDRNLMLCNRCSHEIWNQARQCFCRFNEKLGLQKKWREIHDEIKELGMNPKRIRQTQLYFYNWEWN